MDTSSEQACDDGQTCRRCLCRESIPTHQFIKFDLRIHYLCSRCWEDFRRWFHWGAKTRPAASAEEF